MALYNIQPGLIDYMLADASIAAIVGSRIYPIKMPQGVTAASVVMNRISGLGDHHMQGPSGLSRPRMQIDSYAPTFQAAVTLANAVKERIDGAAGTFGTGSDIVEVQGIFFDTEEDRYDDSADLFRVRQDYFIFYDER